MPSKRKTDREETLADACGVPGNRVQYTLEVRRRGRDDAEDLRRGRLLVSGPPERPLQGALLSASSRACSAECQTRAGGDCQTERDQNEETGGEIDRAALRQEGDRERPAGDGHARREVDPGRRPRRVGRTASLASITDRLRPVVAPIRCARTFRRARARRAWSAAVSDGSEGGAIIAPGKPRNRCSQESPGTIIPPCRNARLRGRCPGRRPVARGPCGSSPSGPSPRITSTDWPRPKSAWRWSGPSRSRPGR